MPTHADLIAIRVRLSELAHEVSLIDAALSSTSLSARHRVFLKSERFACEQFIADTLNSLPKGLTGNEVAYQVYLAGLDDTTNDQNQELVLLRSLARASKA